MFTGIIEEIGEVKSISGKNQLKELILNVKKIEEKTTPGQSICVSGVCLTITEIISNGIKLQIGKETLKTTNLGELRSGHKVHLERGMLVGSRFDGHIVQGHVDGTTRLAKKVVIGESLELTFKYPEGLGIYFIQKGSVAIDGVSLTIQSIDRKANLLTLFLIPHTVKSTLFSEYREGKISNIEVDLLGKYIHNIIRTILDVNNKNKIAKDISLELLAKQGYL
ncbi:riboflavin synthase [bacterium]|nr:riboflavin synthase [bacterium]